MSGVDFSSTASVIPITVTAKWVLPIVDDKFELYGGVGVGLYMATMELEAESGGISFLNDSYDANAFGFNVVGGADFNISETIAIGGEAKWVSVEPDFGQPLGSGKMGGIIFNFNVGVKYKF